MRSICRIGNITKKYKICRVHQQFKEFSTFLKDETVEKLLNLLSIPIIECVKEVKSDLVLDFTAGDYTSKVVGL